MSAYIKELEDGLARVQADLDSARNDTRLAEGAYAMADANIDLLKAENAKLRAALAKADMAIRAGQACRSEAEFTRWMHESHSARPHGDLIKS